MFWLTQDFETITVICSYLDIFHLKKELRFWLLSNIGKSDGKGSVLLSWYHLLSDDSSALV